MERPRASKRLQTPKKTDEKTEQKSTRKWSADEQRNMLTCLKLYGHKNIDKMLELLPNKNSDDIRKYLLIVHAHGRNKNAESNDGYWLNQIRSQMIKNNESITSIYNVAQVIKFLTVDGLFEDHPSPDMCSGIDFRAAYNLVYQALMGYPFQVVNQATAEYVCDCLVKLCGDTDTKITNDMIEHLKKMYGVTNSADDSKISTKCTKVYQRKKRPAVDASQVKDVAPFKVFLHEKITSDMKYYTVKIEGVESNTPVVIPVVVPLEDKCRTEEVMTKLWNNVGFNPLKLPQSKFQRPFNFRP